MRCTASASRATPTDDDRGLPATTTRSFRIRIHRRTTTSETRNLTSDLIEAIQCTINTVKKISEELQPSVLDHFDISIALTHELREFSKRSGVCHVFEIEGSVPRLSPRQAVVVFRIFQESLTNVARHTDASHVRVELHIDQSTLKLMFETMERASTSTTSRGSDSGSLVCTGEPERSAASWSFVPSGGAVPT